GRRPGESGHPGNEAALEVLGVEGGEDIAKVIMRRRSIGKPPEATQQRELLGAEAGDVDEGLRPGQHREQTQQQHLLERVRNLATLARVRHVLEIPQKNYRFAKSLTVRR